MENDNNMDNQAFAANIKKQAMSYINDNMDEKMKLLETLGKNYEKIYYVLNELDREINNKNIDEAIKIYNTKFIALRKVDKLIEAKGGGLSSNEIKNYLNDRNKLKTFTNKIVASKRFLDKAQKYIASGKNIVDSLCQLTYVENGKKIEIDCKLPESAKIRNDMKDGVRQMNALISAAAVFKDCVPPGMSDYIEYNLAAFNAAQVVFTIADQYCVRIERQLAEIEKQFQENNRSKSVTAGDVRGFKDELKKGNQMTYDKQLDSVLGRP